MDNRVSALVISMSYLSIVDISCLRVFLDRIFEFLTLHVSVFLRYTLISGMDSFHCLPSSIRVASLGHTNLEILQSLPILLVFRVFTVVVSIIIMYGKILFILNGLTSLISCTSWSGLISRIFEWSKRERGMVSLKGNI